MSRIASFPVSIPSGVEVKINAGMVNVKGPKGELSQALHPTVDMKQEENALTFAANNPSKEAHAMSGTMRALVNNMVTGVSTGFEKKLTIIGVGYRAAAQGKKLNLSLGF